MALYYVQKETIHRLSADLSILSQIHLKSTCLSITSGSLLRITTAKPVLLGQRRTQPGAVTIRVTPAAHLALH